MSEFILIVLSLAMRLHSRAMQGCQLNPREAMRHLYAALHLVTPMTRRSGQT